MKDKTEIETQGLKTKKQGSANYQTPQEQKTGYKKEQKSVNKREESKNPTHKTQDRAYKS